MLVEKLHNMQEAVTLDQVEAAMLDIPQVDCPVHHHFGPGVYIREMFMPAGAFVLGHSHKAPHMCVMPKGKLAIITGASARIVEGPIIFTAEAGRKLAYVIEDTVFQNVFATEETDIEKLEEMFIQKSPKWLEKHLLTAQASEFLRGAV